MTGYTEDINERRRVELQVLESEIIIFNSSCSTRGIVDIHIMYYY